MGYKKTVLAFVEASTIVGIIYAFIFAWKYPSQSSYAFDFAKSVIQSNVLILTSAVTFDGLSKNIGNKYLEIKQKAVEAIKPTGGKEEA